MSRSVSRSERKHESLHSAECDKSRGSFSLLATFANTRPAKVAPAQCDHTIDVANSSGNRPAWQTAPRRASFACGGGSWLAGSSGTAGLPCLGRGPAAEESLGAARRPPVMPESDAAMPAAGRRLRMVATRQ